VSGRIDIGALLSHAGVDIVVEIKDFEGSGKSILIKHDVWLSTTSQATAAAWPFICSQNR
jgi:hypothetical protein